MGEIWNKVKRHYVRLFGIPENERRAIEMINQGYTFGDISKVLKCDRSSVLAFRNRKLKEGVLFVTFTGERPKIVINVNETVKLSEDFKENSLDMSCFLDGVNKGRDYKEYLALEKKRLEPIRKENMERAKETILMVRKMRKETGNDYQDLWTY